MTTRTSIRIRTATIVLALLVMAAGAGRAHAEAKRLGVVTFKGPAEGATRNVVTKAAKGNKYQVVGGQQIAKAASKLHVTLDDNDGFKSVAKELGISAFVIGEVTKKKATLTVRNGTDGSVSAEASWTGANPRKLSQAVGKTFWRRLGSAIDRAKSPSGAKAAAVAEEAEAPETGADEPAADEPEPAKSEPKADKKKVVAEEAPPADEEERPRKQSAKKKKSSDDESGSETTVSEHSEPSDDEGGMSGEALILGVGPRVVSRSLSYVQDIYRRNSKYNLGAAPEFGLNADFYPGALAGASGIAADIGLTVDFSYLLPVVTSPAPNKMGKYSTYAMTWSVGAKVRLPAGLYGTVAYGDQLFQLTPSGGAAGVDVPQVNYHYLRVGAGGRFAVTPEVSLMANVAYLQCIGALGQISATRYYPKATCAAIEGGGGVGYRLSNMFELQGGVAIRRFGLAFHQTRSQFPGDGVATDTSIKVAGGAVDQFLMGYVALAVVLGGSEGGSGHKSEEAAEGGDDDEAPKKAKAKAKEKDEDGEDGAEAEAPPPPKKSKAKKTDDMDL